MTRCLKTLGATPCPFPRRHAPDFEAAFHHLLNAKREDSPDVDAVVADIIADVRSRGDAAVIDLTAKFDRITLTPDTLRITPEEIADAMLQVSARTKRRWNSPPRASAPTTPASCPKTRNGRMRQAQPLAGAGRPYLRRALCAGRSCQLSSSVLMNAIPAKVAGVERLPWSCRRLTVF